MQTQYKVNNKPGDYRVRSRVFKSCTHAINGKYRIKTNQEAS